MGGGWRGAAADEPAEEDADPPGVCRSARPSNIIGALLLVTAFNDRPQAQSRWVNRKGLGSGRSLKVWKSSCPLRVTPPVGSTMTHGSGFTSLRGRRVSRSITCSKVLYRL